VLSVCVCVCVCVFVLCMCVCMECVCVMEWCVVYDVWCVCGVCTLKSLKDAGVNVVSVISLTNRMEKRDDGMSVKQAVEQEGVKFYSMSSSLEILPIVYKKLQPGEEIKKAVVSEFEKYGVEPLKI